MILILDEMPESCEKCPAFNRCFGHLYVCPLKPDFNDNQDVMLDLLQEGQEEMER